MPTSWPAARCSSERRTRSRSNASPAGTCRVQDGRNTRPTAPSAESHCHPACANPTAWPNRSFTPATKAATGHDINISEADASDLVGRELMQRLRSLTIELYQFGAAHAESCGIILADTKFEFGLTATSDIILIDEALTPDSSRYWPQDQYAPGGPQPSFDKQYVRDYLEQIRWNKQPPVPSLPDDVIARTRQKYVEAYRRLTGKELA
jgi:phosphoribosylaminoimidazole-succinocarboxamide synthase